ncbi:MAG: DUF4396 domain-containing protein [Candidatus Sulfotelmatobacter sp.]
MAVRPGVASISMCFACSLIIVVHELRRPQEMMIMNIVWPLTALYFGPVALWSYFKSGSKMTRQHMQQMQEQIKSELREEQHSNIRRMHSAKDRGENRLTREQVAVATMHCGAGCTLGDMVGEWWIFSAGLMLAGGVLGTRLLLDFLLAWALGVVFQYFTIAPMRGLSFGKGLTAAIRADTASIVAFQTGMSAWAALSYFILFRRPHLHANDAVFWFMMQVGMIIGFLASYPVNILLIKKGWKEKMPQYKSEMKQKMRLSKGREAQVA